MSVTVHQVAQWMKDEVEQSYILYQDVAASEISSKFGEQFTYINENGNVSISKLVLKEFKRLTESNIVWERGERCWRIREDYDVVGRRQAE